MAYDKETKQELSEQELREDIIKEASDEIDDGALEQYIEDNLRELSAQFTQDCFTKEFRGYCKEQFNEGNE